MAVISNKYCTQSLSSICLTIHLHVYSYYRNVSGVIVVYDVTNEESFVHVQQWLDEIDKNTVNMVGKILGKNIDF